MVEMQKGTGPDALPHGAATALNESAAPPAAQPDLSAQPPAEIPVEYATAPRESGAPDPSDSENLNLLTMPADPNFKPPRQAPDRVPKRVIRNLPLIMEATKDPAAPRAVTALYRAIIDAVESEQAESS